MKRFVLVTMALVLLMSMSGMFSAIAFADGEEALGDIYYFNPEGWPTKHWVFMTNEEVASYEAAGWEQNVGVLWYDRNWDAVDINDIEIDRIGELYNDGYRLAVLYTWICPASVLNKYQEQSVSVGTWILSAEQVAAYYTNGFVVPELPDLATATSYHFMTQGYFNGQACGVPDDSMVLTNFRCARFVFELHDFMYGSKLYIRNGEYVLYTFEEIQNGLENEIPWHAWE